MSEYVAELSETVYTANVNEPHIVIADDRSVLVPDELKEIAVQFDHNIETVTFDCPRYWDEHDLSKMHIFINYKCANGRLDGYLAENVEVDADDESIIHFTWTLKENITCANGKICFLVCAKKSNEEGVLQNRWNSKPCNDCYVVEGLDVDVSEEIEQSLDLVEQILLHLDTSAAEAHACAKRAEVAAEEARSAADNAVSSVKENFDVIRDEKITEIASATGVEIANVETAASEATAEARAQIEAKGAAVLATIPEEYTETYTRAIRNESRISRNEKRITNLEQGIEPDPYHVDDTVAYSKDVPANALPYAEVGMIGGRTLKWNQKMDTNQIRTETQNGITLTFNGDGSITVNGQATERATFNGAGAKSVQVINGHRYYINCGNVTVHVGWAITTSENGADEQIVTATEDFKGYPTIDVFSTETVFSNKTFFPKIVDLTVMYGAGNEPTSVEDCRFTSGYEPYDEGSLRSAPVTEVESVGANMLTYPYVETTKTMDNVTFTDNGDGSITIKGTPINFSTFVLARNEIEKKLKVGEKYYIGGIAGGNVIPHLSFTKDGNTVYQKNTTSFTLEKGMVINSIYVQVEGGVTANETIYPMLSKKPLPYTPYTRNTLPIPEAVQALDGYGWGVNANCYNYIDWEKKQFVKRVGKVDLGTLDWLKLSIYEHCFISYGVVNKKAGMFSLLAADYENRYSFTEDKTIFGNSVDGGMVYVVDNRYTDEATFKAAMSGVMLYYELAEPIITDISDLLPEDNYIPVEGGGTVTMANEYGYAVPSEITFALREAE